jgi:hypothetical protein
VSQRPVQRSSGFENLPRIDSPACEYARDVLLQHASHEAVVTGLPRAVRHRRGLARLIAARDARRPIRPRVAALFELPELGFAPHLSHLLGVIDAVDESAKAAIEAQGIAPPAGASAAEMRLFGEASGLIKSLQDAGQKLREALTPPSTKLISSIEILRTAAAADHARENA